ncbi:AarF/ABC1/UbiB kinase family protein [Paenibacillus chondroitinus]|uniref:AarF/ABC1/UbiB kinase family protein n=1 Tax=Paenibacillus chondroitinus TaxID=59842 RepID=A0ABU6DHN1_9BACL|nr:MULTISPECIES: AarF/ABC1/UbiB kinase family protein [Paenibacillus]MCY9662735.1 AarF/ABC1/UbiB kinase family protein [Paenibacillus anseongense]MEB4797262.1 AarF/ABC1/UbiB kinase family protein [Paenibacillus chondroitinus]
MRKRIRQLQRYRDIVIALVRHGFGFLVEESDLLQRLRIPIRRFQVHDDADRKSLGLRIRDVVEELGPTFIKLGQIASTRMDLLPEDIVKELQKLQDDVKPIPYKQVQEIIQAELGQSIETIYDRFEEQSLAAASIGQVHLGVLHTGERVAIKIQRPQAGESIRIDLEILADLAAMAERRFAWARRIQMEVLIAEFGKSLLNELDYTKEARNAEKIADQFKDVAHINVPLIYSDYCSKKVMTMQYIEGVRLYQEDQLDAYGYNRARIANRLIQTLFHQIFVEGLFHADPHPGNIVIQPGEVIALLDFGMVGRLTSESKFHFSSLIIALMRQNTDGVIKAIYRIGLIDEELDMEELRFDIEELRERYFGVPLSRVSLGGIVNDLFEVAYKYHIRVPADFILLGKTLLTIEGVVTKLDPTISIVKIAEPFGLQLLLERLRPKNLTSSLLRDVTDYGSLLIDFPRQSREFFSQIKKGKLHVNISVTDAYDFLRKLDRIGNRITFGIVLLSFSLIMMGLIIGSSIVGRKHYFLLNVPTIEVGFVLASLMSLWLLFSIFKSGRF